MPRNCGPVDPVENRRDVSQGRRQGQGGRGKRRFLCFFGGVLDFAQELIGIATTERKRGDRIGG